MNAGVSTTPRGKVSRPRRALPSSPSFSKDMKQSSRISGSWSGKRPETGLFAGNEHGVPVTEKAIAFRHRLLIRRHGVVMAREGAHQHDQGGFGQMKVGDHCVHCLEPVTRVNKNIGLALEGPDPAAPAGGFQ